MFAVYQRIFLICSMMFLAGCQLGTPANSSGDILAAKTASLELMDKATEPYASHAQEVTTLKARLDDCRQKDAAMKGQEASVAMWDKLINPEGDLLGGFLNKWERQQSVSTTFIELKKPQIDGSFETLATGTRIGN